MRRKISTISFLLMAGMIFLNSCKQDSIFGDIVPNTDRVIAEFTDSQNGGSVAMDYSTSTVTVDLTELRLYIRSIARTDVKIKFVINPTVVADYNAANGTSYAELPATAFSFEANEITLTQTDRAKMIRINIKPSILTGGSFAIGLSISEVNGGEISAVHKNIFVEVKVKNAYEGDYHATGLLTAYGGPTNAAPVTATYPINEIKYLSTINLNTVESSIGYTAFTGGYLYAAVNTTTNQVTISPSLISPTFSIVTNNGTCVYNPATKTFTLNYKYYNGAGNVREIQETLVAQ